VSIDNEFYIETSVDGHPICINGVSLSKKELLAELNALAEFQIKGWSALTEKDKRIKELEAKVPPEGLVWITREEHKDYEQQLKDIEKLKDALLDAACIKAKDLEKANTELVKSARLIADYLENEYGDTDGVIECRRMADKYEVKQ